MMRRTKIVATLGPASFSAGCIASLTHEGVDVFRINSAHTPDRDLPALCARIRAIARRAGRTVGILQDLPGPKLRLGRLADKSRQLRVGDSVVLFPGKYGESGRMIPVNYRFLCNDLKPGHLVYMADGTVQLEVVGAGKNSVDCRVIAGGVITSGKGVNLPDSSLTLKAFTKQDRRHLKAGMRAGVDFVGISFAGNGRDIRRARKAAGGPERAPFLIAKFERREALRNLEEILAEADGVMVARGDLGVEISFAEIPGAQKYIVKTARQAGKPAIVATQVMESMTASPRPTRAEVTDIAHAVEEGADAIMLSAETSIGRYPVEAVQSLDKVIRATEPDFVRDQDDMEVSLPSDFIVQDARDMAEGLKAKAILVPSRTGRTVMRIARSRPNVPILALVHEKRVSRLFSLYWGVTVLPKSRATKAAGLVTYARRLLKERKLALKGDRALIISGGPGVPAGETGMVQIVEL